MKKAIKIMFLAAVAVIALAGCANKLKPLGTVSSKVKKPEMLDHKNLKWDKPVPGWVAEEPNTIEKTDDYRARMFIFLSLSRPDQRAWREPSYGQEIFRSLPKWPEWLR